MRKRMKRSLRLATILLTVGILVACQTAQVRTEPIEVPPLATAIPTRPTLERLSADTSEALKAQTINVSRLTKYGIDWERFFVLAESYYQTVIDIIQGKPVDFSR